jgi:hypothetical protein
MRYRQIRRVRMLWMVLWLAVQPASAITLTIDYRFDTNHFFDSTGNSQWSQARAALEAAASYYNTILTNSFTAIVPPSYHSTAPGGTGVVSWNWQASFQDPSDVRQTIKSVTNPTINANTLLVFAGAHAWSGDTAALGGYVDTSPSTQSYSGNNDLTPFDWAQVAILQTAFDNTIKRRGQVTGFVGWGGSISFDNDATRVWTFNHLAPPVPNATDFYSTAIHELGHVLGFGVSAEWQALIDPANGTFKGSNAKLANHNVQVPLDAATGRTHWAKGTTSNVYGTRYRKKHRWTRTLTQDKGKNLPNSMRPA